LIAELLRARLRPEKVIYVHSQSLSGLAAVALFGLKCGKAYVYHNPDYYDPFAYPWRLAFEKQLARRCDLYIGNEYHRNYMARSTHKLKCPQVLAPTVLPKAWRFPPPSQSLRETMMGTISDDSFILILHGGFGEIRMVPELFEALGLLPPRFKLVMFMREHREPETLRALLKYNISDRVLRLPGTDLEGLLKYTVNADAGVLLYENNDLGNFFQAPQRLTEYVGSGIPVVATNHTGLENLVWRFDLGVTVDSTKPRKIADGILRLEAHKREGRFPVEVVRRAFLENLAFDLWEPDICTAFDELLLPANQRKKPGPPAFPWLKSEPD
jgi:glycosyltransferase involved in cell wall biosynthesis